MKSTCASVCGADLVRHVIHHDDAVGTPVVAGCDGAEALLSGRVPLGKEETRQSCVSPETLADTITLTITTVDLSVSRARTAHNLKLYGFAVQLDGPDLEVHSDGADVALCVRVILV